MQQAGNFYSKNPKVICIGLGARGRVYVKHDLDKSSDQKGVGSGLGPKHFLYRRAF